MLPIVVSVQLSAPSATAVTTAQTLGSATNFAINGASASGGVATFAAPRRLLFTFAADETGHIFTTYGTGHNGQTISEAVAGTPAGTVQSANDFLTVTRVTSSAATTGNVSVGDNGVGSSRWVYFSPHMTPTDISVWSEVSGTVNYTIQWGYQDPAGLPTAFPVAPVTITPYDDPIVTGASANSFTATDKPVLVGRVTVNSGTGTVTSRFLQAGISGP